jgi:hypothetical protein
MFNKTILFLIALLILAAVPGLGLGQAKEETDAAITELTATTSDTHLLLFGSLHNSFTEEMIEGLHSGIPIQFSFFVELHQQTKTWTGKIVASQTFTHTLTYDILKETYRVELEEDKRKIHTFTSLLEAENVLNELNGIKVIALSQLVPDSLYTLQVKAELFNKTLPLSLQHVVPFVSWWDIKTDWQKLTFKY